jgi:SpoVK/Ycf46/Vps4 family AAA+-type ATPase
MQEHRSPVFLIATANDIEALPPELLRKGRFDEIFFVDLPPRDARMNIFAIHLKKRSRDAREYDLAALADASDGFSGAEIEQAVVTGLHEAFASRQPTVKTEHIMHALKNSPPLSVTMAEKVAELREWSRGRCVPAD